MARILHQRTMATHTILLYQLDLALKAESDVEADDETLRVNTTQ
nr:hypothetical protein BN993_03231 [Virgibacillus halodenitrificans]